MSRAEGARRDARTSCSSSPSSTSLPKCSGKLRGSSITYYIIATGPHQHQNTQERAMQLRAYVSKSSGVGKLDMEVWKILWHASSNASLMCVDYLMVMSLPSPIHACVYHTISNGQGKGSDIDVRTHSDPSSESAFLK